ncbi:MAG: carbohydrate kinase family protein [Xanthomonadales bacterium]|nr:Adenosine kinase [Xanthomonadales bacterium]MCC6594770.1 carbohydrate kinase family protein [Xanthomonadales bacterium]MCE7931732.1 carbohydrate kinase family protein [Xanthomonadales bacterium PRO6]
MAPKQALICGSMAYDTIMVFEDRFKNHILADKVHMLSVAFYVPTLRREFGGCAGNISYNLKLLGGDPVPFGAVGRDFAPYRAHFEALGIDLRCVRELPDHYTAQAYITTDLDDNQITAFHPGAMTQSHGAHVRDVRGIAFGIVAPDNREAMLQHAAEFKAMGVPFIFDPGQAMPLFNGEEFRAFIENATYVSVNDYESQLLSERTGWSAEQIAQRVSAYIVTRGGEGSRWHTREGVIEIPTAKAAAVVDPTGCGDAYRAGLIYGLMNNLDFETSGRIASLMGAIKIEQPGTQNQRFTRGEFHERFRTEFGYRCE